MLGLLCGWHAAPARAQEAVEPAREPDVENYLVSGRYDVEIAGRLFWNAGGSWDRNTDAGILSRYSAFAGVGNTWRDDETLRFATTYAASYTDRREAARDPRKDARFSGARLGWEYRHRLSGATVVENELTANVNLTDAADYSLNTVAALSVGLGSHLALGVSLQLLYESDPPPKTSPSSRAPGWSTRTASRPAGTSCSRRWPRAGRRYGSDRTRCARTRSTPSSGRRWSSASDARRPAADDSGAGASTSRSRSAAR